MSSQVRFTDLPTPQRRSQEGVAKDSAAQETKVRESEQPQLPANQQAVQTGGSTLSGAMGKKFELGQSGQEQAAQAAPPTLKAAAGHSGQQKEAEQDAALTPNQQALKRSPVNLVTAMQLKNGISTEAAKGDEGKGKEKGELSRPTDPSYYQPLPINGIAMPRPGGRCR